MNLIKRDLFPLLFIICSFACTTESEIKPEDVFVKYFGIQKQQIAYDIKQNGEGEFIIFGTRKIDDNTANDYYIIKADASGNLINDKSWGIVDTLGVGSDDIAARVKIIDGGYLVVGNTAELNATTLIPGTRALYWARLDQNFDTLNTSVLYATTGDLIGKDIILTANDSVVVTGTSDALESNQSGLLNPGKQIFVAKYAKNSKNPTWRKTFGFSNSNDEGVAIFQKENTDLIIFGVTDQIGSNGEGGKNTVIFQINALGTSPVGQVPKYGTTGSANDVISTVIKIPGGYAATGTSTLGTTSSPFVLNVDDNALAISNDTVSNPFKRLISSNTIVNQSTKGIGLSRTQDNDFVVVGQILNYIDPSGIQKNHEMMFLRTNQFGVTEKVNSSNFGLVAGNDEAVGAITLADGSIAVVGTADFGSGVTLITLIKMNDKGLIKD